MSTAMAAAQKLAMAMVPVVVLEHLSPTQRRALVIADNRIAENAGWDETMLRVEMEALQLDDFDMSLTGFDADALAELMAGGGGDDSGNTDDDDVPEVLETAISRTGDVWLLGPHRLLCGDSTLAESYAQLLQGEEVDMVFTDPPYNVNYANTAKDKMRGKNRAILNDNLGDGFYDFLLAALTPIRKWITAPDLGAQVGVDLVNVPAAKGFLSIPAAGDDRCELGIDDDSPTGRCMVQHNVGSHCWQYPVNTWRFLFDLPAQRTTASHTPPLRLQYYVIETTDGFFKKSADPCDLAIRQSQHIHSRRLGGQGKIKGQLRRSHHKSVVRIIAAKPIGAHLGACGRVAGNAHGLHATRK